MPLKRFFLPLVLACVLIFGTLGAVPLAAQDAGTTVDRVATMKFDFRQGRRQAGWIPIDQNTNYDAAIGYGFDLGTSLITTDQPDQRRPFYFSVKLPEGNYHVSVTLGDRRHPSTTTVKAESRRLMLDKIKTAQGEYSKHAFSVNVKTPKLPDGKAVGLKAREVGVLHWDDKLTLEFNGDFPTVDSIEIKPAEDVVTVYLLGDSTVTDQPSEPWNSWGQMLTVFFGDQVSIANHSASGESLRGALSARRIKKVLGLLRPGDYLFVQFGHNDMKDKSENALATYRSNLIDLIRETRQRSANPVLVTSMERKLGVQSPTLKNYPQTVRDVAHSESVPLIDLNRMSLVLYQAMGAKIDRLFQDGTHHNAYGSYQLAKCVVNGIKENVPKLAVHLRAKTVGFDPAEPIDFDTFFIPQSPAVDLQAPEGN